MDGRDGPGFWAGQENPDAVGGSDCGNSVGIQAHHHIRFGLVGNLRIHNHRSMDLSGAGNGAGRGSGIEKSGEVFEVPGGLRRVQIDRTEAGSTQVKTGIGGATRSDPG